MRITRSCARRIRRLSLLIGIAAGVPSAAATQPTQIETLRISGNGPQTFVLLSGFMGGVAGFRQLEDLLVSRGNRVIVIDSYRLSADSADLSFAALARRVGRTLDEHHVTSARLVGHSHGGGIALRVAATNPTRVTALYLLDVGALTSHKGPIFSATLRLVPIIARFPGGKGFLRGRIVKGLRESSGNTAWLDKDRQRAYSDPFLNNIDRIVSLAIRLGRTGEPASLSTVIAGVRVPTTVVLGDAPHTAGPVTGELDPLRPLGALLRIERVAGVGHFLHEEAPLLMAALLVSSTAPVSAAVPIPPQ